MSHACLKADMAASRRSKRAAANTYICDPARGQRSSTTRAGGELFGDILIRLHGFCSADGAADISRVDTILTFIQQSDRQELNTGGLST